MNLIEQRNIIPPQPITPPTPPVSHVCYPVGKIAKKTVWSSVFLLIRHSNYIAMLSKIHSYRLLFRRRFCPLGWSKSLAMQAYLPSVCCITPVTKQYQWEKKVKNRNRYWTVFAMSILIGPEIPNKMQRIQKV